MTSWSSLRLRCINCQGGEDYCINSILITEVFFLNATHNRVIRKVIMRASSHLASRIERPNPKLLSRGEDKSSLKYIINVFLSNFEYFIEKKFDLSTRVWVSVFDAPKLFSRGQNLGAKSTKKCYHVGTLEAFHLWSLATSVKAQRSTSRHSTNHIARFLHLSNRLAKCEDPQSFLEFATQQ